MNFYYLKLRDAVKLPILVAKRTRLETGRGGVKIVGMSSTGMLMFGYRSLAIVDSSYERSKWHVKGLLIIKGKVNLGRGTNLVVAESGTLIFGDKFIITGRSTIICRKRIEFGAGSLVSWDVLFMDTDYHPIYNKDKIIINDEKPILVGKKTWIGCRSLILKGSVIPDGSVISAGSVIAGILTKKDTIYTSNKTILKENVYWQL